jgi:hypothetical protein
MPRFPRSQIDSAGRVLFTADAYRDNGKRFIVSADEKLTAFLELERIARDDSDWNQTAPLPNGGINLSVLDSWWREGSFEKLKGAGPGRASRQTGRRPVSEFVRKRFLRVRRDGNWVRERNLRNSLLSHPHCPPGGHNFCHGSDKVRCTPLAGEE